MTSLTTRYYKERRVRLLSALLVLQGSRYSYKIFFLEANPITTKLGTESSIKYIRSKGNESVLSLDQGSPNYGPLLRPLETFLSMGKNTEIYVYPAKISRC